ncbi:P-loop containing nucleoside triphosphate hydrolase protein [Terfezia claveryi]|nr:P-loop containing nucleoside triphosphate hydrolase protein [Terfezia claveryi]
MVKRKHPETDTHPALAAESQLDQETTFASLGLDTRLLQGIAKLGFAHPTAVQAKAIPLALEGKDILARAKTGSGKTAAYLLPVLQSILKRKEGGESGGEDGEVKGPSALVLVPTKELADQVCKAVEKLSAYCGKVVRAVNLAQNVSEQVQQSLLAESPDIVISTPSRALAHASPPNQSLTHNLTHLVIDEADLVLSYGYESDLLSVSKSFPKGLQTFLASATLTSEVETLKKLFCRSPVILRVHDAEDSASDPNGGLKQYVVRCAEDEKFLLLYVIYKLRLIKGKSILFVGDIDRCYRVRLFLEQFGIRACVLNSELPVNSRLHIVQEFNKNVYDIIIATDENEVLGEEPDDEDEETTTNKTEVEVEVKDAECDTEMPDAPTAPPSKKQKTNKTKKQPRKADKPKRKRDKEFGVSRGIDFHNVSCVLNFDLPTTSRSYTHRIGRTARAGKAGMALSFVVPAEHFGKHKPTSFPGCKDDEKALRRIQRHQRKRAGLPPVKKPSKEDAEVDRDLEGIPQNAPLAADDIIKPYIFDMTQANAFRYRMTDALRAVTKLKIREARLNELRSELVKSEKLKRWFEENPGELKALRHDVGGAAGGVRMMPHLKHVPDYLLPKTGVVKEGDGMARAGGVEFRKETENRIRRARLKKKFASKGTKGAKGAKGAKGGKGARDPLKSFKGKRV